MKRIGAAVIRFFGVSLIVVGGGYSLASLIGFVVAMTERFQSTDQSEIKTFGQDMSSDAMLFSVAFVVLIAGIGIRLLSRQTVNQP
jgi:hypothetical protein